MTLAHRPISKRATNEVTAILLFSVLLGQAFMYSPTLLEFFWAFSRFLDVFVEIPQLRMLWSSDKLDEWIIAYYCSVGAQVLFYTLSFIHRFVRDCSINTVDPHLPSFHLGIANTTLSPIPPLSSRQPAKAS